MLKIVVVTESLYDPVGGPYWSVKATIEAFLSMGHFVYLFGSRDSYKQPVSPIHYEDIKEKYCSTFKGFALKKIGPKNLHLTPSIMWSLPYGQNVDLVLLQGPWTWNCWIAFVWAKWKGIPVFMSVRGEFVDTNSIRKLKKRPFLPWVFYMMRKLDGIHVLNQREADALKNYKIYTPYTIIPNGVHLNKEVSYNFPRGKVLYLGKLHVLKNVLNLVSAWKKVENKNDWELIIAGDGDEEYKQKLKNSIGDDSSIKLIGIVHGVTKEQCFLNATWFILPSLLEGMPVAVLEAMGYQVPVMCSKECNLDDFMEESAVLDSGTSIEDLHTVLTNALRMSMEERARLSSRALEILKKKYVWNNIGSALIHFFNPKIQLK